MLILFPSFCLGLFGKEDKKLLLRSQSVLQGVFRHIIICCLCVWEIDTIFTEIRCTGEAEGHINDLGNAGMQDT